MVIVTNNFDLSAGFLDHWFALDKKYTSHIAGVLITDGDFGTLLDVFPSMGNTIVVGGKKDIEDACFIEDLLDGTALVYRQNRQCGNKLGAYVEVDKENKVINYHVTANKVLLYMSFDPALPPDDLEETVVGAHFGCWTDDETNPLFDMLEEFGDMVKGENND